MAKATRGEFGRRLSGAAVLLLSTVVTGCAMEAKVDGANGDASTSLGQLAPGSAVLTSSFASINNLIIQPRCVSCHGAIRQDGGINLATYDKLMGSGTITARYPTLSSFYTSCQSKSMPPAAPLSPTELQAVSNWIKSGAPGSVPPSITAVLPATGSSLGSTQVTVSGAGFSAGISVTVGGVFCSSVNVLNASTFTCVPAAHSPGSVEFLVSAPDGSKSALGGGYNYLAPEFPAPTVASISPTSGSSGGGTSVTLTGTGFRAGIVVAIGNVTCDNLVIQAPTQLTCVTRPKIEVGPAQVLALNADSQRGVLGAGFTYQLTPAFRSVYQSIITPKCLGCHGPSQFDGDVNLYTYFGSIQPKSIIPGSSTTSKSYSTSASGAMPPGTAKLSSAELQAFRTWIDAGALNN